MTAVVLAHPTSRLAQEFAHAWSELSGADLCAWGRRSAVRAVPLGVRRLSGAVHLAATAWREAHGAAAAAADRRLAAHLTARARQAVRSAAGFASWIVHHPSAVLGFLLGSGGMDADGGIPDLDLARSVGDHRSIFTHSVLGGLAAELLILAALDLGMTLHAHLPPEHHPVWDTVCARADRFGRALSAGLSVGVAYHLIADATFDGMTPYKDLPISAPIEFHRATLAANGATELLDTQRRRP